MNLALDTNRYVDFVQNDPDVLRRVQQAQRVVIAFVVLAELRAGFADGTKLQQNEQILNRVLASPRVEVVYPDDQTTHHYSRLHFQLKKQGTPIPINDLWLAAVVAQHGLVLYARDKHFDHLPQIPRI